MTPCEQYGMFYVISPSSLHLPRSRPFLVSEWCIAIRADLSGYRRPGSSPWSPSCTWPAWWWSSRCTERGSCRLGIGRTTWQQSSGAVSRPLYLHQGVKLSKLCEIISKTKELFSNNIIRQSSKHRDCSKFVAFSPWCLCSCRAEYLIDLHVTQRNPIDK